MPPVAASRVTRAVLSHGPKASGSRTGSRKRKSLCGEQEENPKPCERARHLLDEDNIHKMVKKKKSVPTVCPVKWA